LFSFPSFFNVAQRPKTIKGKTERFLNQPSLPLVNPHTNRTNTPRDGRADRFARTVSACRRIFKPVPPETRESIDSQESIIAKLERRVSLEVLDEKSGLASASPEKI
jgi:hypothetical protein